MCEEESGKRWEASWRGCDGMPKESKGVKELRPFLERCSLA